jgi:cytoskeletal protein CcmA (bactofilin family)
MFDKHRSNKQSNPSVKETVARQESPTMSAKAQPHGTKVAVIGPGIEITGEVTASADLLVFGLVNGPVVQSSHSVEIGETGRINARVRAKLVKISGEVNGDISGIEKVLISKTGQVRGNIVAPRLQLEDGALFKGSIDMNQAQTSKPAATAEQVKGKSTSPGLPGSAQKPSPPAAKVSASAPLQDSGRKEPSLTLKSG